jgi:hypothetical protein
VVALSEALYQDLALVSDQVHASVLCPYSVPTGIAGSQSRWAEQTGAGLAAATPSQRVAAALTELSVAKGKLSADDIATLVLAAVRQRQFYIYSHPQALGTVRTRMEDLLQARNPSDPFAEKPALRQQLLAALAQAQTAAHPDREPGLAG